MKPVEVDLDCYDLRSAYDRAGTSGSVGIDYYRSHDIHGDVLVMVLRGHQAREIAEKTGGNLKDAAPGELYELRRDDGSSN